MTYTALHVLIIGIMRIIHLLPAEIKSDPLDCPLIQTGLENPRPNFIRG